MRQLIMFMAILLLCVFFGCGGDSSSKDAGTGTGENPAIELAKSCTTSGFIKFYGLMDQAMRLGQGMIRPTSTQIEELAAHGIIYSAAAGTFSFSVDLDNDGLSDAEASGTVNPINLPYATNLTDGFQDYETGFNMHYEILDNASNVLGDGVLNFINLGRPASTTWKVGIVINEPNFIQDDPCSEITITSLAINSPNLLCFTDYYTSATLGYELFIIDETVNFFATTDPATNIATISATYGSEPINFVEDLDDSIPACIP